MLTCPKNPFLRTACDDDVVIFHSGMKNVLEMANDFSLHFALHSRMEKAPAEHYGEQILYHSRCCQKLRFL